MAALQGDDTPSAEMVAEYERRRDFIYEAVNQIPGCSCQKPDSAFYMFVNIKKTLKSNGWIKITFPSHSWSTVKNGTKNGHA